jgi:hypothetical protein
VGQPVTDDALIGYVVSGLHPSFTPIITSLLVASRFKSLTFIEFHDELLSYELLLDSQNSSTTTDSHHFAMFPPNPMLTTSTVSLKPQESNIPIPYPLPNLFHILLQNLSLPHSLSLVLNPHSKSMGS